jgi:hypothetical protein
MASQIQGEVLTVGHFSQSSDLSGVQSTPELEVAHGFQIFALQLKLEHESVVILAKLMAIIFWVTVPIFGEMVNFLKWIC